MFRTPALGFAMLCTACNGSSDSHTVSNVSLPDTWSAVCSGTYVSSVYSATGPFEVSLSKSGTALTGTLSVPAIEMTDSPLTGVAQGTSIVFGDIAQRISFTGTVQGNSGGLTGAGTYTLPEDSDHGTWTVNCNYTTVNGAGGSSGLGTIPIASGGTGTVGWASSGGTSATGGLGAGGTTSSGDAGHTGGTSTATSDCSTAPDPCGGDLTGTWKIIQVCNEGDLAQSFNDQIVQTYSTTCSNTFQSVTESASGSVTYDSGTMTTIVTLTVSETLLLTPACFSSIAGQTVTVNAAFCSTYASTLEAQSAGSTANCAGAGDPKAITSPNHASITRRSPPSLTQPQPGCQLGAAVDGPGQMDHSTLPCQSEAGRADVRGRPALTELADSVYDACFSDCDQTMPLWRQGVWRPT